MPFQLPSPLPSNKQLSVFTIKVYKNRLNKLANAGFDTVHKLLMNPYAVQEVIKQHANEHDETKRKQDIRVFLSAIFWIVPESYLQTPNPYYNMFQTVKTPIPD